jgi:anthranilate phosphoribosyltransferase
LKSSNALSKKASIGALKCLHPLDLASGVVTRSCAILNEARKCRCLVAERSVSASWSTISAVCGADGLDEITTTGPTHVAAVENGTIREFEITPEEAGLQRAELSSLQGGEAAVNAGALMRVLAGEKIAYRDIGVLNAAAALVIADRAKDLASGAKLAAKALDDGAALETLRKLIAASNAT